MASEQFVRYEVHEGIATLTLDRAPVNVINIPMLEQMEVALGDLADNGDVRTLLLQAEGKMFSAGVDVADHTADKVGVMIPLFNRVCVALAEFPVPTVAAVHGHALGGGCELVLCCDLAVMSQKAKIGQPEIQLAVFAPVAALRLAYLVGYRAAADIQFSGRNFTADEALQVGLVNAVVEPEAVGGWAQEKAAQIAGLSRAAQIFNKRALQAGFGNWANAMADMEKLYLEGLMKTADAEEGLVAFMEKRPPEWKHS